MEKKHWSLEWSRTMALNHTAIASTQYCTTITNGHQQWSWPPAQHPHPSQVDSISHLEVPVEQLVELEVVVVLSKRIIEGLGDSEPTKHEEEPERHEDGIVEIHLMLNVFLLSMLLLMMKLGEWIFTSSSFLLKSWLPATIHCSPKRLAAK